MTLSGALTPGQSGPGNDGNEGVLRIPENSSITGTSPSNFLVSYQGHLLGEFYPSAEIQSMYSAAQADWAIYVCIYLSINEAESKINSFFFSTRRITDTGRCITQHNETGPLWITSLLLNIICPRMRVCILAT